MNSKKFPGSMPDDIRHCSCRAAVISQNQCERMLSPWRRFRWAPFRRYANLFILTDNFLFLHTRTHIPRSAVAESPAESGILFTLYIPRPRFQYSG
jgi:hypothetical protein